MCKVSYEFLILHSTFQVNNKCSQTFTTSLIGEVQEIQKHGNDTVSILSFMVSKKLFFFGRFVKKVILEIRSSDRWFNGTRAVK